MITYFFQTAVLAIRSSCDTARSTMKNKSVTKIISALRRNNRAKVSFNLFRILTRCQTKQVTDPYTMCVANDSWFPVDIPHNKIGGFPSYTRKRKERIEIIRNNGIIFIDKFPH